MGDTEAGFVVHEGKGKESTAVVTGSQHLRHDGGKVVAKHFYDHVHRGGAIAQPDHVDWPSIGSTEVIDRSRDSLEGAVADRVGDHAGTKAHGNLPGGSDEGAGQSRWLISLRWSHNNALG